VEARVAGMLGDAYSELKQNDKAVEQYKKSASLFPEDANMASEYLFRAGLLLEMNGKSKEAIEVYKQLKDKFPRTEKGFGVDKYLARLGDTN
jgi:tetratricopeptide (TPR) repeat protein